MSEGKWPSPFRKLLDPSDYCSVSARVEFKCRTPSIRHKRTKRRVLLFARLSDCPLYVRGVHPMCVRDAIFKEI